MNDRSIGRFSWIKQALMLVAVLLLAACAGGEQLAEARGPWRQLNIGYWQATPADLNPQLEASHGR